MEAQLKTAETHGIRTVALRIAPVFTSQGGVLGIHAACTHVVERVR
jgi:NAD dependent epimerase/dehydratase family enzyme